MHEIELHTHNATKHLPTLLKQDILTASRDKKWKKIGHNKRLNAYEKKSNDTPTDDRHFRIEGYARGTLHDALTNVCASSTREVFELYSQQYADVKDAKLLHTMQIHDDKVNVVASISIHWVAMSPDAVSRDYCILQVSTSQSTHYMKKYSNTSYQYAGITKDLHGNDVGYVISQSINLYECPDMLYSHGLVRSRFFDAKIIKRSRYDPYLLEIQVEGTLHHKGSVVRSFCKHYMHTLDKLPLFVRGKQRINLLNATACIPKT